MQCFFPGWVFAILGGHVLAVVLLLRLAALCGRSSVWSKLQQAAPLRLCGCSLGVRLPLLNDIMLLVVCMAGLPSCYVSDITAPSGMTLAMCTSCIYPENALSDLTWDT